ncbi:hypothetical protein ACG92Y_02825 [Acinetobacter ursingii]|uniref:hypothetical protein n=1 Tax=Acinetobacter TaxID=469 RepID=UPI00296EC3E6|nr:hypothetical protein [Acinetobacter sp. 16]
MRSEFDELKRFAIADVLSVSGKEKTTSTIEKHIDNIIDVAIAREQNQQSKIDELQKRVEELTVGCGLQRDHIKGLEAELKKAWTTVDQEGHKNHELLMLLKFVREHFEMNDLDKAMPRVYEKLEQALKGGGE